jgi:hypothetical protein
MPTIALTLGLVVCLTAPSACSGTSTSSTSAAPSSARSTTGFQAYLSCLSQNGVTITPPSGFPGGTPPTGGLPNGAPPSGLPAGGFPGGGFAKPAGVDDATWQKAQKTCASLNPIGQSGGPNDSAWRAYRNCLANHGVNASPGEGQPDSSDPTMAAAQKACAALLPTGVPTPAPTN